ncbi:MAG TPA: hypothetical protein VKA46_28105 [Gemmataceae bacterium]|nr:hypothetical protein [Gemmataceae bacterium]
MAKRSIATRAREALAFTQQLVREGKSWVQAMNAVYGLGGKCAVLFPTRDERSAFLETEENQKIGQLLDSIYEVPPARPGGETFDHIAEDLHVRLPHAIVRVLRARATAAGLDLDQFLVMKLTSFAQAEDADDSGTRPKKKRA